MTEALEQLVGALREELQQYGEMLARLDEQQQLVMRREAARVLESVPGVQEQTAHLNTVRDLRAGAMKKVCAALEIPADSLFEVLLPVCPENYRILIGALVQENNSLLHRVHQRARQNHLLLSRTVESMQRVIHSLTHNRPAMVYDESGSMFTSAPGLPALYEAVG